MEKYNRIISFLPSATEILFEIGLGRYVSGVTHECTYPLEASKKPIVIKPVVDFEHMSGDQIDEKIKELSTRNQPIFKLDNELVRKIQPDLLISQDLCSVCAPFSNEVAQTFKVLGYNPSNLVLNPKNLSDVLKSITELGMEVGNFDRSVELHDKLVSRIHWIQTLLESSKRKNRSMYDPPRVLCLDWINPFYMAGHWVPDMIDIAGGLSLNGSNGMDSRQITMSDIEKLDPDVIVVAPCGYDLKRTQIEYDKIDLFMWRSLKAYKENQIYLVDANSFFSKPSPRIITGIEILCHILYPDLFSDLKLPNLSFTISKK